MHSICHQSSELCRSLIVISSASSACSYKFLRLFPLSQDDLPITKPILPLPNMTGGKASFVDSAEAGDKQSQSIQSDAKIMDLHHEQLNPEVSQISCKSPW